VPPYGGLTDVYISQNRFFGPRRAKGLTELCALYSDLDYYKIDDLAPMSAPGVMQLAFEALEQNGIPLPSFVVSTGRGLALV
jgi:hypothetical protein